GQLAERSSTSRRVPGQGQGTVEGRGRGGSDRAAQSSHARRCPTQWVGRSPIPCLWGWVAGVATGVVAGVVAGRVVAGAGVRVIGLVGGVVGVVGGDHGAGSGAGDEGPVVVGLELVVVAAFAVEVAEDGFVAVRPGGAVVVLDAAGVLAGA